MRCDPPSNLLCLAATGETSINEFRSRIFHRTNVKCIYIYVEYNIYNTVRHVKTANTYQCACAYNTACCARAVITRIVSEDGIKKRIKYVSYFIYLYIFYRV